MMSYSKRSDLCEELIQAVHALDSKHIEYGTTVSRSVTNGHTPKAWRIHDRLTTEDVDRLIKSYHEGVTGRELAQRFGIGLSSVKNILSQHGKRKKII